MERTPFLTSFLENHTPPELGIPVMSRTLLVSGTALMTVLFGTLAASCIFSNNVADLSMDILLCLSLVVMFGGMTCVAAMTKIAPRDGAVSGICDSGLGVPSQHHSSLICCLIQMGCAVVFWCSVTLSDITAEHKQNGQLACAVVFSVMFIGVVRDCLALGVWKRQLGQWPPYGHMAFLELLEDGTEDEEASSSSGKLDAPTEE